MPFRPIPFFANLIWQESSFDVKSISRAGAFGSRCNCGGPNRARPNIISQRVSNLRASRMYTGTPISEAAPVEAVSARRHEGADQPGCLGQADADHDDEDEREERVAEGPSAELRTADKRDEGGAQARKGPRRRGRRGGGCTSG